MTAEELLRPRFKVIADYPESMFDIGKIEECAEAHHGCVTFYGKYPAIFKRLDWWEERAEGDMPEYLKHKKFGYAHKVVEWLGKNIRDIPLYRFYGIDGQLMQDSCYLLLPISETEYNNIIKTSPAT